MINQCPLPEDRSRKLVCFALLIGCASVASHPFTVISCLTVPTFREHVEANDVSQSFEPNVITAVGNSILLTAIAMVNVIDAAQGAIDLFATTIRLLAVPNSNVSAIAAQLAPIYLPTYYSITLGKVTARNQTNIRDTAAGQFQRARDIGLGTDVKLVYSRIEPISNESAIAWLTLYYCPPPQSNVDCYSYEEPFGFRLNDTINNGLDGGWEWGIGDQEFQAACARFPNLSAYC